MSIKRLSSRILVYLVWPDLSTLKMKILHPKIGSTLLDMTFIARHLHFIIKQHVTYREYQAGLHSNSGSGTSFCTQNGSWG